MSRKNKSILWDYFEKNNQTEKKAQCLICGDSYSYKGTTGNLKTHLKKNHLDAYANVVSVQETNRAPQNIQDPDVGGEDQGLFASGSRPAVVLISSGCGAVGSISTDEENDILIKPKKEPPRKKLRVSKKVLSESMCLPKKVLSESVCSPKKVLRESTCFPKKISANTKKSIDECLVKMVAYDFQPFSIVEDRGFVEYTRALNPNYELPSRKTLSNVLMPIMYEEGINNLKKYVAENVQTICLTVDSWTSKAMDHYIAVTGHFLTNDLELKSIFLQCAQVEGSQNGTKIAQELRAVEIEWNIVNKINFIVTDNASNMLNAVSITGWNHIECYAHQLNLIVQQALAPMQKSIDKVSRIVSHFKKNVIAKEKLQRYQLLNQSIEVQKTLIKSVSTCWNSVYLMLERFVTLEEALKSIIPDMTADLPILPDEEWISINQTCIVLKPFFDVTELMSGESYLKPSLALVMTAGLLSICSSLTEQNFCNPVQDMINLLKDGIENQQRMDTIETQLEVAICGILDPRFKSSAFRQETAFENAKSELIRLSAEHYMDDIKCEPKELNKPVSMFSIWRNVDEKLLSYKTPKMAKIKAAEEVEMYLRESIISRDNCPFEWWRERKAIYPSLFEIFRTKCNIVVTSVPCERIFSKAGYIINDRRTRLTTSKVKQLMFLNCNKL